MVIPPPSLQGRLEFHYARYGERPHVHEEDAPTAATGAFGPELFCRAVVNVGAMIADILRNRVRA